MSSEAWWGEADDDKSKTQKKDKHIGLVHHWNESFFLTPQLLILMMMMMIIIILHYRPLNCLSAVASLFNHMDKNIQTPHLESDPVLKVWGAPGH